MPPFTISVASKDRAPARARSLCESVSWPPRIRRIELTPKIQRVSGTPERHVEHAFAYDNTYVRERLTDGGERLRIGLRGGHSAVLRVLGAALSPPYRLLYVLHTSRTGAVLGRYESPGLDGPNVEALVRRFGLQAGSMGL